MTPQNITNMMLFQELDTQKYFNNKELRALRGFFAPPPPPPMD